MGCLDENAVVDFIEGRMDASQRVDAEEHLAHCADCRRVLARTAEALLPTGALGEDHLPLLAPLRGLVPNDMVGRYRVLHRVGAGAMGVVYAAEDKDLRRKVALKLLRADPSQPAELLHARLMREARAASAIRHPNVVPVHDVLALEDGSPVLVMDLLVGEPLRARLEREGALDVGQTARILVPVLSALEAAHALGVIHRDLKPDNIFLSTTDSGELDVKIVDFGVAKLTALDGPAARSAGLTETGALVGTPYYMAPEQAFGEKDIDARADLWAVGVMLYECLAGSRPTEASNVGQVLKVLAHLSFPPLEQVAPDLPPRLASLVGRLLCERDRRIETAAEVKRELLSIVEDPSLVSQPGHVAAAAASLETTGAMETTMSRAATVRRAPESAKRWPKALVAGLAAGAMGLVAWLAFRAPTAESPDSIAAVVSTQPAPSASSPADAIAPSAAFEPVVAPAVSVSARPPAPIAVRSAPSANKHVAPPVGSGEGRDAGTSDPTKLMTEPPF